jgi:hypothetical protein
MVVNTVRLKKKPADEVIISHPPFYSGESDCAASRRKAGASVQGRGPAERWWRADDTIPSTEPKRRARSQESDGSTILLRLVLARLPDRQLSAKSRVASSGERCPCARLFCQRLDDIIYYMC